MNYEEEYYKLAKALHDLGFDVYDEDDGSDFPLARYRTLSKGEIELAEEYPYGDERSIETIGYALNRHRYRLIGGDNGK